MHFCVIRFLWIYMFEDYDTIVWFKLAHPEIITITLSNNSTCCIGTVVCRYRNFFNRPITLSTCMVKLGSCLEVSTSHWDNFDFSFAKQGILRTAPADTISSWSLKPLSARTRSPKFNFLRNPDSKVVCLSDTCPPHSDERKLTRPVGVTQQNIWLCCYVYSLTRSVHGQLNSLVSLWMSRCIYNANAVTKLLFKTFWKCTSNCSPVWPCNEILQVLGNNRNKSSPYMWNLCCLHVESVPNILMK